MSGKHSEDDPVGCNDTSPHPLFKKTCCCVSVAVINCNSRRRKSKILQAMVQILKLRKDIFFSTIQHSHVNPLKNKKDTVPSLVIKLPLDSISL